MGTLEAAHGGGGGMSGSLAELTSFMSEQQQMQLEREDKLEAKLEAQRQEIEAKLEAQRQESEAKLEAQRLEIERLCKPHMARDVISEQQLETLQLRLEALHEARLLTDEELESLEDAVVDCIEVLPAAFATEQGVVKVMKMILIVEKVASDKVLARQLRRKFI
jgi:hypothetical protein